MTEVLVIPDMGDSAAEGTIVAVLAQPGDSVDAGQPLLEVETDKAVMEVPATAAGTIEAFLVSEGDRINQGAEFVRITCGTGGAPATDGEGLTGQLPTDAPLRSEKIAAREATAMRAPAGPAARKLARELGIVISDVIGSGNRGQISKEDVIAFAQERSREPRSATDTAEAAHALLPAAEVLGPHTREPLSGVQKATSSNMSKASARIPHAWLQEKIDITELEAGRQQIKEVIAKQGESLTLTALLSKVVSLSLKDYPIFNAMLDEEREEIVYRHDIHIGVAVDTPRGLVVPVLRHVDRASLMEICIQLSAISEKARRGRLTPADMRGGSITISNLGGIGTSGIFPIINWPEVAIVGVGKSKWMPCYKNGNRDLAVEPRLIMPLTLAFDHRVINGADGARFFKHIKDLCEKPALVFYASG